MDRILLLNPPGDKLYQRDLYCSNVSKANYYWPAIDLLIQSGILGEYFEVDVLDAIAERLSPEACLERIRSRSYRAALFLTGTASWQRDFDFMASVKQAGEVPLLVGNGDILLYKAEEFLKRYAFLDAVLLDYTTPDVALLIQGRTEKLSALAFRENGGVKVVRKSRPTGEFTLPVPHHHKFPLKKYLLVQGKRFPFTTVQASFGCPFRCSYCIASTLDYKYRPVDNVLEELRHIVSLGVKEVFFMDFTFEVRRDNTLELCRRMVEEKLGLTWVCSSRAATLDEELLTWMKKAGCHTILIGVESGDEELLVRYSKGVTKDQMRRAFSICRRLGIRTLGHFIIGLPGETEETARKTVNFAKELDCDIASFNIAVPVIGTRMREEAIAEGLITDSSMVYDSSDAYPVLETESFSKEQAWKWRKRAIREFYFRPRFLWRTAASARSFYQLKLLVLNGLAVITRLFRRD